LLTNKPAKNRWLLAALTFCVLASTACFASLGGDAASVQSDVARMQGALRVTASSLYSVQEIQLPTGTTVREYLSPSGTVFAVAWHGPFVPDLKQLLGSYFTPFQQAARAAKQRPGHVPVSIHQSNLVVEHGGHMRDFFGRAYLTDQLPAGVTEGSIQ
jgi:hypothetical protein